MPVSALSEWQRGYAAACFEQDLQELFEAVEQMHGILGEDRFNYLRDGLYKILRSYDEIDTAVRTRLIKRHLNA